MILKGNKGFTLIEMLIVMLVITVLLLIMIPNVLKHNTVINNKGCSALVKMDTCSTPYYNIDSITGRIKGQIKYLSSVKTDFIIYQKLIKIGIM